MDMIEDAFYELLRGCRIGKTASPAEVPCNETSDMALLCKEPLVSVHMTVYNHERYLKQAIESVVNQETDFDYEIVIGEDASQDSSREICFEYQRRYPDKIRVLWSDKNVFEVFGNWTRVTARCRGRYVAFCEGDDFWIDRKKLQKQVNVFRENVNIGICFSRAIWYNEKEDSTRIWKGHGFDNGLIPSRKFCLLYAFGDSPIVRKFGETTFIMTPTVVVRNDLLQIAFKEDYIFRKTLTVEDAKVVVGVGFRSDAYFMCDVTATYRHNPGGISVKAATLITRDGMLIRMFYGRKFLGLKMEEMLSVFRNMWVVQYLNSFLGLDKGAQKKTARELLSVSEISNLFDKPHLRLSKFLMRMGLVTPFTYKLAGRLARYWPFSGGSRLLMGAYKSVGLVN